MSLSSNMRNNIIACNDVSDLCTKLFEKTPISWFAHARFYRNRELKVVMSHAEMQEWYLQNNHHHKELGPCKFDDLPQGILFTNLLTCPKQKFEFRSQIKEHFGYDNYLGIFVKADEHYDMFTFASDSNEANLSNFYFNNVGTLKNYTEILYDSLKEILNRKNVQPLIIPEASDDFINIPALPHPEECLNIPLESIVNPTTPLTELTKRELQLLTFIARGYTSKQIASILHLSYRTVQNYTESLKRKLNCRSKLEVVANYSRIYHETTQTKK